MPSETQLRKYVKSGRVARDRFNRARRDNKRLTFSGAQGGRPLPLRKKNEFISKVQKRAASHIAHICRDLDGELMNSPEGMALPTWGHFSGLNEQAFVDGVDGGLAPPVLTYNWDPEGQQEMFAPLPGSLGFAPEARAQEMPPAVSPHFVTGRNPNSGAAQGPGPVVIAPAQNPDIAALCPELAGAPLPLNVPPR